MLTAYFDASGTDQKDDFLIMAGFIAPASPNWTRFEREWADLLAVPRYAERLPMRDGKRYAHGRRIAQWPATLREAFYLEANYLLRRAKVIATAVAYAHADYTYAFDKYPHTVKDSRYGLSYRMGLISACKLVCTKFDNVPLAVVLELGDPNQGAADVIFKKTKEDKRTLVDGRRKFNLLTQAKASKEEWGALQVADLHAYTLLKHLQSPLGKGFGKSGKYHGDINFLLQELAVHHFGPKRTEIHRMKEAMLWAAVKAKVWGAAKYGTAPKSFAEKPAA